MKYNRELLKPIFEQTAPNLLLNKLTYNYGTYTITAWDQFCSKYAYDLTLFSDRDTENITRFIQILNDNKHKIDLILQKQNLVRDLLLKDSYFTNLTTERGGVDTTNNTSNSTSNSTQNNTTDNKTITANSTQNADNKNLTIDKDTQMSIIDELSKNINYDLFNSTNIQNSNDNNTSIITFGSNTTTITKNTAEALNKILSINIKPLLDDFWNSFKGLFNYTIKFDETDLIEPNVNYLNDVLRPFIEQQLNNYNLTTLDNRVENYLDNKINLTIEQKDNLINEKINSILGQKDNKINNLINGVINTKRGFITHQIEELTNSIKTKLEEQINQNISQLRPQLEIKIKELIENENIEHKIEENINLKSNLINEKVEQSINALTETIKNKVSNRFDELLPIVDLKFHKEIKLNDVKEKLNELEQLKSNLTLEIEQTLTYLNQSKNELEYRLTNFVNDYFEQKKNELTNKASQTEFSLETFFQKFNEAVKGIRGYEYISYEFKRRKVVPATDGYGGYWLEYQKETPIVDIRTFLNFIGSLIVSEDVSTTIFRNMFTSDNHPRGDKIIFDSIERSLLQGKTLSTNINLNNLNYDELFNNPKFINRFFDLMLRIIKNHMSTQNGRFTLINPEEIKQNENNQTL